jgi:hypothetical protein
MPKRHFLSLCQTWKDQGVQLELTLFFATIFNRPKRCQLQSTSISRNNSYLVPNYRNKILGHNLVILHKTIHQKWYFISKFRFFWFNENGWFLISNSIFELPKMLVSKIYFPKPKLHFPLLHLYSKLHLSTIYKLYLIFVYKNCSRANI